MHALHDRLLGRARRILGDDDAEDAVQEAWTNAYLALRSGASPSEIGAWLDVITRNASVDRLRERSSVADLHASPGRSVDDASGHRASLRELVAAIKDLPPAEAAALVARVLEGKGHAQIAREQNTTSAAVRTAIHRARSRLRAQLERPAEAT